MKLNGALAAAKGNLSGGMMTIGDGIDNDDEYGGMSSIGSAGPPTRYEQEKFLRALARIEARDVGAGNGGTDEPMCTVLSFGCGGVGRAAAQQAGGDAGDAVEESKANVEEKAGATVMVPPAEVAFACVSPQKVGRGDGDAGGNDDESVDSGIVATEDGGEDGAADEAVDEAAEREAQMDAPGGARDYACGTRPRKTEGDKDRAKPDSFILHAARCADAPSVASSVTMEEHNTPKKTEESLLDQALGEIMALTEDLTLGLLFGGEKQKREGPVATRKRPGRA